jgi:hypothetical protein
VDQGKVNFIAAGRQTSSAASSSAGKAAPARFRRGEKGFEIEPVKNFRSMARLEFSSVKKFTPKTL